MHIAGSPPAAEAYERANVRVCAALARGVVTRVEHHPAPAPLARSVP